VRPASALPGPAVEIADGGPATGVADDDEDPRLAVLGTGRERRRLEDSLDKIVVERFGPEGPAGALTQDDVEEIGHRRGS
jgi:hypothetical protein